MKTYEQVDNRDKRQKNNKLNFNLMCSVGGCVKIFGGIEQLKHHYKLAHPEAFFEIDFPVFEVIEDKYGKKLDKVQLDSMKFLEDENKRTQKFMDEKKKYIKEDVELAKKKYIKRNTLFRMISDDYKEHRDYDEINQKKRRYERKSLDIDFYIKAT